jgi:L-arabinose isomerase
VSIRGCQQFGGLVKSSSRYFQIQPKNMKRPLRVGLFGIGLDAYWPQFKGLKPRLEGYVRVVHGRLKRPGVEVVNLGPILEIGNTNSRYRFTIGARQFVNDWNAHGPAHHCAVGVGHVASKIEKLGQLLGIEVARIGYGKKS